MVVVPGAILTEVTSARELMATFERVSTPTIQLSELHNKRLPVSQSVDAIVITALHVWVCSRVKQVTHACHVHSLAQDMGMGVHMATHELISQLPDCPSCLFTVPCCNLSRHVIQMCATKLTVNAGAAIAACVFHTNEHRVLSKPSHHECHH